MDWIEERQIDITLDETKEVRFIGKHGYSEHASFISKKKGIFGRTYYTVKSLMTGKILTITGDKITDIISPDYYLDLKSLNSIKFIKEA